MTTRAWRTAQGGEPIDNDSAEGLEEFYVAHDDTEKRSLVTRKSLTGPWWVRGVGLANTYDKPLGRVELVGGRYLAYNPGAQIAHSSQAALLYALGSLH